MFTYLEALQQIFDQANQFTPQVCFVDHVHAIGRVLAEDLSTSSRLPDFDTSAMDGFALRSELTLNASAERPMIFRVLGSVAAGDNIGFANSESSREPVAYEVMTGARFPPGLDACVKLEDVRVTNEGSIEITAPISKDANRRLAGEDFASGTTVLTKGHVIRTEDLLCLAALGLTKLPVFAKLRVAVISTGKELVDPDVEPSGTQIRNSTQNYLIAALTSQSAQLTSVEVSHVANVGDDPSDFLKEISGAREKRCDLILTTGAISVGKFDFVARSLVEHGLEVLFQKVRIRPGKPLLFGRLEGGPFVLGLPGNPVATATGFRFFAVPLLRALAQQSREVPLRARLSQATRKPPDTACFFKASLRQTPEGFEVQAHANQKASMTNPLLQTNSWIALEANALEHVLAGTYVDVYPFG